MSRSADLSHDERADLEQAAQLLVEGAYPSSVLSVAQKSEIAQRLERRARGVYVAARVEGVMSRRCTRAVRGCRTRAAELRAIIALSP